MNRCSKPGKTPRGNTISCYSGMASLFGTEFCIHLSRISHIGLSFKPNEFQTILLLRWHIRNFIMVPARLRRRLNLLLVLQNFGEINLSLAGPDVESMKWQNRGDALMSLRKLMRFEIIGDQRIQFAIKELNGE